MVKRLMAVKAESRFRVIQDTSLAAA